MFRVVQPSRRGESALESLPSSPRLARKRYTPQIANTPITAAMMIGRGLRRRFG
jgi:hypothetical protein